MYTTHGHYIDPPMPGENSALVPLQCGGPARGHGIGACMDCTREEIAAARLYAPTQLPAVLNSPAPTAPSLPSAGKSSPVQVPIDGVKDWYQRFLELKDAAKKIEDMLDEARSAILDSVKSQFADLPAKTDFTIDGRPVLQRQVVVQNRVDTKRLKAEKPDVHSEYLKSYEQERLNIL